MHARWKTVTTAIRHDDLSFLEPPQQSCYDRLPEAGIHWLGPFATFRTSFGVYDTDTDTEDASGTGTGQRWTGIEGEGTEKGS